MAEINLTTVKKVHFVGLGGIGVSAIARLMLGEGKIVSGSDLSSSLVTTELEKLGAKILPYNTPSNITTDLDLVIYTIAVPTDELELARAREQGIPTLSYPEMLELVSANKFTIAISGTHGKTTTTAMVAKIMLEAKLDPTVIVGSLLLDRGKNQGTNFIFGRSQYLVVEACEYRRSFLNLSPEVLVITNIDNDHLDYYKDLADITSAFIELAKKIPVDGYLIYDGNNPRLEPVVKAVTCQTIDYSKIELTSQLLVPGEHNKSNARAALAVAKALGLDCDSASKSLNTFRGTWRRFEYKGQMVSGTKVYDDYAHHPTEIAATIGGARSVLAPGGKLTIIFQPHLYSRAKLLLADFVKALALADRLIILPIYAAREAPDESISSQTIVTALESAGKEAYLASDFAAAVKLSKELSQSADLIVTTGAGNISQLPDLILE